VREVQDALKQLGYYSGPLDGLPGPQTQGAIAAYETQNGREASGIATPELLASLRSSGRVDLAPVPTEVASTPASGAAQPQPAAEPDGTIAAVQEALARSAYGPLTVDGVAGPATRDAIKKFQHDHNLPITGDVTDALIVELRADGAMGGG
jgi:peptidoglycan hydrolase-like protein with peptidoglycan-binding domain